MAPKCLFGVSQSWPTLGYNAGTVNKFLVETTMSSEQIVIVGMARTPMGAFQGNLTPLSASDLGAAAIKGALADSKIPVDNVNEVFMGCVLPAAGVGQAPARQAALGAGLSASSNDYYGEHKVCGSGLRTVAQAYDSLLLNRADVIVAGGMESMTNAPYLMPGARGGLRMGHNEVKDHMFLDGLENAYDGKLMGCFAENTATKYSFSREAQDEFAITSLQRAQKAIERWLFYQGDHSCHG